MTVRGPAMDLMSEKDMNGIPGMSQKSGPPATAKMGGGEPSTNSIPFRTLLRSEA